MDLQRPRLLVVDDDRTILALIRSVALTEGFDVATTDDAADALVQLHKRPADLFLLDLQLPGVNGLDILRSVHDINSRCKVVLMSAFGSMEHAVEAVKLGATDYLTKPFDLARLRQVLRDVRDEGEQRRAVLNLELDLAQRLEFCGMIGRGAAMQDVFAMVRRLAPHATTVLVKGEPGTGKELVARAFHRLGPRSHQRFVTVNCLAMGEAQFESELFGHVRGAFAGATDRVGILESADGATVFLDEVAELPLPVQARLLRLLETNELERMGSVMPRRADVRVIAATNRDLPALVASGRFMSELLCRLSVVELALPPLRERREDIPFLTAAFVRAFSHRFNKALTGLTPGAERMLAEAPWHGNVRQLRNVLERACILADGDVVVEANLAGVLRTQPPPASRAALPLTDAPAPLHTVEREHIVRTLQQVRGNKAVAARLLGISRRAFYRQLERHGLHQRVAADEPAPADTPYDVEHL